MNADDEEGLTKTEKRSRTPGIEVGGEYSVLERGSERLFVDSVEDLIRASAVWVDDRDAVGSEPGGDRRALALLQVLEIEIPHPPRGMNDPHHDPGLLSRRVNLRDAPAVRSKEFHPADSRQPDGQAVDAVSDIGARAVGPVHVAREMVVRSSAAAAFLPPTKPAILLVAFYFAVGARFHDPG